MSNNSPIVSMMASKAGITSKELSPRKEVPAIDSIDTDRIMRSVHGSVEKLG